MKLPFSSLEKRATSIKSLSILLEKRIGLVFQGSFIRQSSRCWFFKEKLVD